MNRFLIILSALIMGCSSLGFVEKDYNVDVQGHRGARAVRPENTIPAIKEALEAGVNTLEFDLVATKDRVLILNHDPIISGKICTGPNGQPIDLGIPFINMSLKEAKSYDCGRLKNPRFPKQKPVPGTKIPTFAEVLEYVKTSGILGSEKVMFNVELKSVPAQPQLTPDNEEYVDLFLTEVKKAGVLDRMVLQSFDHRLLRIAKEKEPQLKISALIAGSLPNLVVLAKDLKAEYISPYFQFIDKEVVESLHKAGVKVVPWTLNEEKDWELVLGFGVDGIITDDPRALISYLRERQKK